MVERDVGVCVCVLCKLSRRENTKEKALGRESGTSALLEVQDRKTLEL